MNSINDKKIIFISGLHRSGTSYFYNLLKNQPDISGFENTGFPEDEGQFLQDIMPYSPPLINPGRFAFYKEMHLTENSKIIKSSQDLIQQWSKFWDLSKNILVEKSPPNLIRQRFLQQIFPNSYFITIIRHPIAVSYATKKWTKDKSLDILFKHWIRAYNIYLNDVKKIKNNFCINYEEVALNPELTIQKINKKFNLHIKYDGLFKNKNSFYLDIWDNYYYSKEKAFFKSLEKKYLILKYEKKINKFGYSLKHPKGYKSFNTII